MLYLDNEARMVVQTLSAYKIRNKPMMACRGTQEYERCNALAVLGVVTKSAVSGSVAAFELKNAPFSPGLYTQAVGRAERPQAKAGALSGLGIVHDAAMAAQPAKGAPGGTLAILGRYAMRCAAAMRCAGSYK